MCGGCGDLLGPIVSPVRISRRIFRDFAAIQQGDFVQVATEKGTFHKIQKSSVFLKKTGKEFLRTWRIIVVDLWYGLASDVARYVGVLKFLDQLGLLNSLIGLINEIITSLGASSILTLFSLVGIWYIVHAQPSSDSVGNEQSSRNSNFNFDPKNFAFELRRFCIYAHVADHFTLWNM